MIASLTSRLRGLRARSALLAAGVVVLTLALGAALLLSLFRNRLEANLDSTLLQQATDRAQLIDQGTDPAAVTDVLLDESLVWIGTPDGTPTSVSGALVPLENPVPATIGGVTGANLLVEERSSYSSGPEIERERMGLRLASVATDGGLVVVVGAEQEPIDRPVNQLGGLFVAGLPLLVLVVGGLTWLTTGRVLRPVERIRRRADEVTGSNLGERVPVPETGDEIEHLAVTMNEMLDRIEVHEASLRRFTADASHELKSPVANLRALVGTAEVTNSSWPALQQNLEAEADRLRDLVDNLLFLASSGAGGATAPVTVHLDDLLFDEAELLAATGRVAVNVDGVSPVSVTADRRAMERLVRNLVDNAARHARSTVSLGCGEDTGDRVRLTVGDDGPGIPVDDRDRVFERFTRLDDARARDTGGSGLGLPIVRQIADGHGAEIAIGDAPGGGALITILFPSAHPRAGSPLP